MALVAQENTQNEHGLWLCIPCYLVATPKIVHPYHKHLRMRWVKPPEHRGTLPSHLPRGNLGCRGLCPRCKMFTSS